MVIADPSLIISQPKTRQPSTRDTKSRERRLTEDNERTASQQRPAKDAAPASSERKTNGEVAGSERRRDLRHEAAAQSWTLADAKTSSRSSLGTLNELGPTVPVTPTVVPPESAPPHSTARQRKRPRARSLGTRAEWSETSVGDTKDRQGIEAVTVDAARGHADAKASWRQEEATIDLAVARRMEAVMSVYFARSNFLEEAKFRMSRCRGQGDKPPTAASCLTSAGLLACMAALAATSLVAAPSSPSPPTLAVMATAYAFTFVWWDPGAGLLWVSLLVVALGLAKKTGGDGGNNESKRWLSFCLSVSALAWLCLYHEKRSRDAGGASGGDGGASGPSEPSVRSDTAGVGGGLSSRGPSGPSEHSRVKGFLDLAWCLGCALTVSPLFLALELLVECGYRPYLLPEGARRSQNADNGEAEGEDVRPKPRSSIARLRRSLSAGSEGYPLALKETE